jgi:hypothetical protein
MQTVESFALGPWIVSREYSGKAICLKLIKVDIRLLRENYPAFTDKYAY